MLLRMKAAKLIVGRSRSREGAGLEKEQGQEGQKQGRTGAEHEQGRSRNKARAKQEQGTSKRRNGA